MSAADKTMDEVYHLKQRNSRSSCAKPHKKAEQQEFGAFAELYI